MAETKKKKDKTTGAGGVPSAKAGSSPTTESGDAATTQKNRGVRSHARAFVPPKPRKKRSFVDALLSCPKLDDGETLDVSRDPDDCGRAVDL